MRERFIRCRDTKLYLFFLSIHESTCNSTENYSMFQQHMKNRSIMCCNYKYLYINDNRINSWYKDSRLIKERMLHKLFFVNEYKNWPKEKSHFNSFHKSNWTSNFSYIQNKNLMIQGIKSIESYYSAVFRIQQYSISFPINSFHENKSALPFEYSNKRPSIQQILLPKYRKKENPYLPRGDRSEISARYPRRNIEEPARKIKPRIICQDLSISNEEDLRSVWTAFRRGPRDHRDPHRFFFCSKTLSR